LRLPLLERLSLRQKPLCIGVRWIEPKCLLELRYRFFEFSRFRKRDAKIQVTGRKLWAQPQDF